MAQVGSFNTRGQTVIRVIGLNETIRAIRNLPMSIARESKQFRKAYAEDWQRQLKLRAPIASGQLKESIKVMPGKKDNETIVSIDSPYGAPQAMGFRPHWVHESMGQPGSGYTMGDWAQSKGLPAKEFYFVRKPSPGTGFYDKTENLMLNRLQKYSVDGVKAAIKKAGFKGG